MIFFTSDTYFGHKNVVFYNNRPFKTLEEHDETLISNWNKRVSSYDTIYHLGDFSFKDPYEYKSRLNGNIILINGNHDFRYEKKLSKVFGKTFGYLAINIENQDIFLCHYAMRVWNKSHFNSWNLFGHSHGELKEEWGKSLDVGVDSNNFEPISFKEVKEIMNKKPNNFDFLEYRKEEK